MDASPPSKRGDASYGTRFKRKVHNYVRKVGLRLRAPV